MSQGKWYIETVNDKQRALAEAFLEAYAEQEGDELAQKVSVVGKRNNKLYVQLPDSEEWEDYSYREIAEEIRALGGTVPGEEPPAPEPEPEPVLKQGRGKTKRSTAIPNLVKEMLRHATAGARGRLALGVDLLALDQFAAEEGLSQKDAVAEAQAYFSAKGTKFPNPSDRSRFRACAQLLQDNGYDLETEFESPLYVNDEGTPRETKPDSGILVRMPIGTMDVGMLYAVRHLFRPGEDEHNANVMALCHDFSYKVVYKLAPHMPSDPDEFAAQLKSWTDQGAAGEAKALEWALAKKDEAAPPEFKAISGLPATLVDRFKTELTIQATELATEAGVFTPVDDKGKERQLSNAALFELLVGFWDSLGAEQKLLLIKHQHGVATPAEHRTLFEGGELSQRESPDEPEENLEERWTNEPEPYDDPPESEPEYPDADEEEVELEPEGDPLPF